MLFQVYFIIIYWIDEYSSLFYTGIYKKNGDELKNYFLINFNDIKICD